VRDTEPGQVALAGKGKLKITKKLSAEDQARKARGLSAVEAIYRATGAKRIIHGSLGIGLHLMGGCALGKSPATSVVSETFQVHRVPQLWIADSSVFPNAPGINPSLTIMALARRAAESLLAEARHGSL
jgi:choline dehydrogenase-like flavoprotein